MSFARPLFVSVALALASVEAPPVLAADGIIEVQRRLEDESGVVKIGQRVVDLAPLRDFYRQRSYRLAWSGPGEGQGDRLLMDMQAAAMAEGLLPETYAVTATGSDLERDLLISDALVRFGRDLATGRVQPARIFGGMGPETRPTFDAAQFLKAAAAGKSLSEATAKLPPAYAGYARLKQAQEHYRQVVRNGGWPAIPDGPSVKPGQEDERVLALRKRLIASGELPESQAKGKLLDSHVVQALKKFQARHGLDTDGALGKQTLAALNIPAEERLRTIQVNLERWRWMPRQLDAAHIAVNIAAAQMEMVEDGAVTMAMRVVVGDVKHPTPGMATTMNSVVVNPTWTVPPSIATKEILPKLKRDPNYLSSNNIRILDRQLEDGTVVAATPVDWSRYKGAKFPYRLRQDPGPDNALGQVKFSLTNDDDIYLHDTPSRQHFAKSYRHLSHGCVRLERPVDLAKAVLEDEWAARVPTLIGEAATKTIKLEKPLSVYLLYMTAWVDDDGVMHFRDDVYEHDARLKGALKRPRGPMPPQVATQGGPAPL